MVSETQAPKLYVAEGSELHWYDVDVAGAAVERRGSLQLPGHVGYSWPHPSRRFLYVTTRRGDEGAPELYALRIEPGTGALSIHGAPAPLPAGAVHVCIDHEGTFAYVAYTRPSLLTVHRIAPDGTLGDQVPQSPDLDFAIFPHQVRVMPSGRSVILVARGYDAREPYPEAPGALKIMSTNEGVLANVATIAPDGGYGFGVRHLDFHPTKPWVYVSSERHNQIVMFDIQPGDVLPPTPLFAKNTLSRPRPEGVAQGAGTIHVHPNGRSVYLTNRSAGEGEDNVVVCSIDQTTGEPTVIQHADTQSNHVGTFSIDPSGRLFVGASSRSYDVRDGDGTRRVLAGLTTLAIGDDGRLRFVRKYDMDTSLSWSNMIVPPSA